MQKEIDDHDLPLRYFMERSSSRQKIIEEKFGQDVVDFLRGFADTADPGTEIITTSEYFNIEILNGRVLHTIINLKRVNDIAEPCGFFAFLNRKLPLGGYFISCVETIEMRRARILAKYPKVISYPYYFLDFILKRVFPKIAGTRKIYSILTRGVNRVMSITETMGRLAACGFEIVDMRDIGYMTYFVARKVKPAVYDGTKNVGFFIKLRRVGKEGKLFNVHKFRTMHPYAEYLQDYVHQKNCLTEGCKFNNDFRITSWGRIMRKFWIDELPMFVNLFRGQMKLVGVRPLSEQFFSLYPEEFQKERIMFKPGLVPPFYVDLPVTLAEVIESERGYLKAYEKSPFVTDFKYFFAAFYNIIFRKARSA